MADATAPCNAPTIDIEPPTTDYVRGDPMSIQRRGVTVEAPSMEFKASEVQGAKERGYRPSAPSGV